MKKNAWFWGGLAAVCVFCAVYWLAGGNAVYIAHDQYDGDMMNYILHARHLTSATVPEYMGGLDKTFLALGAPLFLPLYALLPPLWAFCAHTTLVALLGYTGMALWCGALTRKPWIACVVGVAFATLPFYTVYGLSVMGQPLLFWLFWRIARRARPVWELVCVTLFAAASSLIFIGFADCALAFCAALALYLFQKPRDTAACKRTALGALLLTAGYAACNLPLLAQVLFPSAQTLTQRAEYVLKADGMPFFTAFFDMLTRGQYHAASYHLPVLLCAVPAAVWLCVCYKRLAPRAKLLARVFWGVLGGCVAIALFYAAWNSAGLLALRGALGALGTLQLDRVYWLYPFLWNTLLALLLYFAAELCGVRLLRVCLCAGLLLCALWQPLHNSAYRYTLRRLAGRPAAVTDVSLASWNDYFAPDLFADIRAYLGDEAQARVVSVGLYPSIALYNGFSCADGYLSNYPLAYKHSFRAALAPELAKNDAVRTYFDEWGNRCYLFASELGTNVFYTKDSGVTLRDFTPDSAALRALGCTFVLSGVPIGSAGRAGLQWEQTFTRADSIYTVYLYRIVQ